MPGTMGGHMEYSHTVADWAQSFGSVFTALAFGLAIYKLLQAGKARRAAEADALKAQIAADAKSLQAKQVEIYQRLEIESNVVFQFEATNKSILPLFKTHLAPVDALTRGDDEAQAEARLIARKYYEICCNLFEVAARLRRLGYLEPEVFGSWVAWYFDTLCEWGFRALWADLRDNYTSHLRDETFDRFVEELIQAWDIPQGLSPSTDLCQPTDIVEELRTRLYDYIGARHDCKDVKEWLANVRKINMPPHPNAFR